MTGGFTALHIVACQKKYSKVEQCLIEEGNANVEAKKNNGDTALRIACYNGHATVVQYLTKE